MTGPFADDNQRFSTTDPRIGYAEVQFSKDGFQLDRAKVVKLEDTIDGLALGQPASRAEFTGDAEQAPPEQGASEFIGFAVALLVLLIVFRTLVAASVPIVFALISVGTAFGLLFLLANLTDFNTITPILISMIGIGVGIDYTLFIVTRFRQALHDGMPAPEAAAYASATAGRAVIFAGVTVAISITGLAVIGIPFVTKLGMGGALGVLTAVLYATFLLPGLLSLIGHQDRPPEGAVPAQGRRVRGGPRAHADGPLGQVHDPSRRRRCWSPRSSLLAGPGRTGDRHAARHRRRQHGAEGLVRPQGVRPPDAGLRRRLQRPDPGRRRSRAPIPGGAEGVRRGEDAAGESPSRSSRSRSCNKAKDVGLVMISPATAPQATETDDLIKVLRENTVPARSPAATRAPT